MKKLQIPQKVVYGKFYGGNFVYTQIIYVHEFAAVNLSKIYFLRNAKKICKPNTTAI